MLLSAIERSARNARPATIEGDECAEDATQLLDDGLAVLSEGEDDEGTFSILTGHDPEGLPFTVILADIAPEWFGAKG